ncbi:MAG: hypothetical protein ACI4ME_06630 [Aristaeellaceae bacterium]
MSPLPPKLLVSGIFGLLYAFISYLFLWDLPDAGRLSAVVGLTAFALFLLWMLLKDERRARRFARAEKQLPCPPSFSAMANLRDGRRMAVVRVYLCGDEAVLVSVERKEPVLSRIRRESVHAAEATLPVQLKLALHDGRSLLLLCPDLENLVRELRKAGWSIRVNDRA